MGFRFAYHNTIQMRLCGLHSWHHSMIIRGKAGAGESMKTPRQIIKSSEVMSGPFVSASSSRSTLARPATQLPLRGAACDLRSGSGLTANRKNLPNASELYPASDVSSCSPRPALCNRPLLALPGHFRDEGDCARVPDAAPTGKTLEAVKERLCFYAFYFCSQQKLCISNPRIFSQVHAVHRRLTGIGAEVRVTSCKASARGGFSRVRLRAGNGSAFYDAPDLVVKILRIGCCMRTLAD